MKDIKAIIVDDELAARNILETLLKSSFPDIRLVAKHDNVLDAVEAIKLHQPDIVFLDIEMPQYAGYEIINFFEEINFKIVFITAYDQYAVKAFEINAIDYLLKPIDRARFDEAVSKTISQLSVDNLKEKYEEMVARLAKPKTIVVAELGAKHVLELEGILAIRAQGAYSDIYLKDGTSKTISKNIGYFENLLADEHCFYRSHKSWLINLNEISRYSVADACIELGSGLKTKLSRFKKAEFQKRMED